MKKLRGISYVLFAVALMLYLIIKTQVYAISVENTRLEEEITNYQKENSDLLIELTNLSSREQLMESYPNLKINDNIYYLKEVDDNDEKDAASEESET